MYRFLAYCRQPVHNVWFITFSGVGLLWGLWLGQWLSLSAWTLLCLVMIPRIWKHRRRWKVSLAMMIGIIPGVIWAQMVQADITRYQEIFGQDVLVSGFIATDPVYGEKGEQQFAITHVVIYGRSYPGQMSLSTYSYHDISRGDSVTLQGKIRPGYGSKQAAMSFAEIIQWQENHDVINTARTWFAAQVRSSIAEPMASLGLGFVIGQRSALPDNLDETLKIVGLTHIVVASGYNLTILVRAARRLFESISAYLSVVTASGLMVGFILLSGMSPSLVRAGVVSGLGLLAWWYGRRFHPIVLIVLAMVITALWWPPYLWSDLGWWLSFLAFYGVLVLASIMKKLFHITSIVSSIVVETISATIMTLPLIIVVFSTVAPLTLPANVLVVPFVPLAMIATTIAGLMNALIPSLGGFFGAPAQLVLEVMIREAEWLASLQAPMQITMPASVMVIIYGIIIIGSLWLYHHLDIRDDSVV